MAHEGDATPLEIELADNQYHVTVHSIEFQRNERHEVERMVYQFRLHVGDGWATFPVTLTKIDDSMEEMWKNALSTLYLILASIVETTRRNGGYQRLSFKDAPSGT